MDDKDTIATKDDENTSGTGGNDEDTPIKSNSKSDFSNLAIGIANTISSTSVSLLTNKIVYGIIVKFLTRKYMPHPSVLKEISLEINEHLTVSKLKNIADKVIFSPEHDRLILKGTEKIILMRDEYVEVIRWVHEFGELLPSETKAEETRFRRGLARIQRSTVHLSLKQTILKLQSKYAFGFRSYGITKNDVHKVVSTCKEPRCTFKVYSESLGWNAENNVTRSRDEARSRKRAAIDENENEKSLNTSTELTEQDYPIDGSCDYSELVINMSPTNETTKLHRAIDECEKFGADESPMLPKFGDEFGGNDVETPPKNKRSRRRDLMNDYNDDLEEEQTSQLEKRRGVLQERLNEEALKPPSRSSSMIDLYPNLAKKVLEPVETNKLPMHAAKREDTEPELVLKETPMADVTNFTSDNPVLQKVLEDTDVHHANHGNAEQWRNYFKLSNTIQTPLDPESGKRQEIRTKYNTLLQIIKRIREIIKPAMVSTLADSTSQSRQILNHYICLASRCVSQCQKELEENEKMEIVDKTVKLNQTKRDENLVFKSIIRKNLTGERPKS